MHGLWFYTRLSRAVKNIAYIAAFENIAYIAAFAERDITTFVTS